MRLDAYSHFVPPMFRDVVMGKLARPRSEFANWNSVPALFDLSSRLEVMDEFGIDMQMLCMPPPALELFFENETVQDLARQANQALAEQIRTHPKRFVGVASVSLTDPELAIGELERCVNDFGFRGVMLYASPHALPLDAPEFDDFYDAVESFDVPIWLHPERSRNQADYQNETESKYGLYLIFGWPYETSIAMARLVLGGVFERHPQLKIITHHAGAMIPPLAKRIDLHYPEDEQLPRIEAPSGIGRLLDRLRVFYADTVATGSLRSLLDSFEFFGADRLVFASDYPFGPRGGRRFVEEAVESIERLPLTSEEKAGIWFGNLARICKFDV